MSAGTIRKRTWVYQGKKRTAYQFSYKGTRKQFETKAEAIEALDAHRESLKGPQLRPMTLAEATALYVETKAKKATLDDDQRMLATFAQAWGKDTLIKDITARMIAEWQLAALKRQKASGGTVAPATVDRALAVLRTLLRLAARKWGVIKEVPLVELTNAPNSRERFLAEDEIARLLAACVSVTPSSNTRGGRPKSPYLLPIVTVALNTGMRLGEIIGLTWDRVDFASGLLHLRAEDTKTRRSRSIPMTRTVNDLLAARLGARAGRVFPVRDISGGYEAALDEAKIEGATFHDLRHTFACHYMIRGGQLFDLQLILGHSDPKMTVRYAKFSPHHLRSGMARMDGITPSATPSSTRTAQEIPAPAEIAVASRS